MRINAFLAALATALSFGGIAVGVFTFIGQHRIGGIQYPVIIFGGVGSVWRTVLGVLILGMITNGFDLLAVADYWQNIVRGVLIIIAVSISFAVDRRLAADLRGRSRLSTVADAVRNNEPWTSARGSARAGIKNRVLAGSCGGC